MGVQWMHRMLMLENDAYVMNCSWLEAKSGFSQRAQSHTGESPKIKDTQPWNNQQFER